MTPATNKPSNRPARQTVIFSLLAIMVSSSVMAGSPSLAPTEVRNYRAVTISNIESRRDVKGEIVDAHDGCLQFFAGRYYLYGTAYGKTAGFSINNRFRVYSSPDLTHWTFEGELLQSPPDGVYYRPYVVFNAKTQKYVLWYNWYPQLWEGQNGVATSDSPVGPFQIANANVQLSQSRDHPGDGSLFVDENGDGYFIYTVIGRGHSILVEKLAPDYLGSAGAVSSVLAEGCEAPVLFRRNHTYYALFDWCCCFCPQGSGARVFTAASPLGPFTESPNINRAAVVGNGNPGKPTVGAQQTWVAQIPTAQGPAFVWMGDRWGSRPDGIKGHDFQFWSAPLEFAPDDSIAPLKNVPSWQARVQVGRPRPAPAEIYLWPKKKDPHPVKVNPCSGQPIPPDQIDGLP